MVQNHSEYTYHKCSIDGFNYQITYLFPHKIVSGCFNGRIHGKLVKAAKKKEDFLETLAKLKLNHDDFFHIPYNKIIHFEHITGAREFTVYFKSDLGSRAIQFLIYYKKHEHEAVMADIINKCPHLTTKIVDATYWESYKKHTIVISILFLLLGMYLYYVPYFGGDISESPNLRYSLLTSLLIYLLKLLSFEGSYKIYTLIVSSLLATSFYLYLYPAKKIVLFQESTKK